jgi:hypothetical protein
MVVFVTSLATAVQTVRDTVRGLDVEALEPAAANDLVAVFAEVERLGAAGKALCAKRVADSGAWQRSGERSAADWLAKTTGTTVGAARGALDTAANVTSAPAVDDAFRAGRLSAEQAEAVSAAAKADPAAEQRLLDAAAAQQPLKKLRDECARVRAAAEPDPKARHREIHRPRFFRTWTDAEGAGCRMYKATPEAAAEIERIVRPYADAAFEAARKSGDHEASEAYAFDGLLAMTRAARDGDACPTRKRKRPEAIVLVNLESLQRGAVEPGELCEIPGVGPVPVDIARDLLGDALLRLVITDGVDVLTAVHAGRLASDVQRTAIEVRQRGRCARPTCGRAIAEVDHVTGWTITGATSLSDLAGLCRFDHLAKTHHGHRYRRVATGTWEWVLPDGNVERERPPP